MSKKAKPRKIPMRRSVRFPGILADADALKVSYIKLWFARTGKRQGKTYRELLARDRQLKEGK